MKLDVVDFAYQIIDMQQTIEHQQCEIQRLQQYEAKYHRLLNESVAHGEQMMGNIMQMVMKPGVVQALARTTATLQLYNEGEADGQPFDKQFDSRQQLDDWITTQNQHPWLSYEVLSVR